MKKKMLLLFSGIFIRLFFLHRFVSGNDELLPLIFKDRITDYFADTHLFLYDGLIGAFFSYLPGNALFNLRVFNIVLYVISFFVLQKALNMSEVKRPVFWCILSVFSLSPVFVRYSTCTESYNFSMFLFIVAWYMYISGREKSLLLLSVAATFTHLLNAVFFSVFYLIRFLKKDTSLKISIMYFLFSVPVYIFGLYIAIFRNIDNSAMHDFNYSALSSYISNNIFSVITELFTGFRPGYAVSVIISLFILIPVMADLRKKRRIVNPWFVSVYIAFIFVIMMCFALDVFYDVNSFNPDYFINLLPFLMLAVISGIDIRILLYLSIFIMCMYVLVCVEMYHHHKEDLAGFEAIEQKLEEGSYLVFTQHPTLEMTMPEMAGILFGGKARSAIIPQRFSGDYILISYFDNDIFKGIDDKIISSRQLATSVIMKQIRQMRSYSEHDEFIGSVRAGGFYFLFYRRPTLSGTG